MRKHLKDVPNTPLKAFAVMAVILVILVSLALLAEGVTRAAYYFNSRRFIHPYLGEIHKPLYEQTAFTPEGQTFVFALNNYGFRGENIPDRKPTGARYVFAIGGSTTACNEYPHERTWPGMLEQQLRRDLGDNRIYVYNAGMASGTSYRSLVIFLNIIARLNPDLVILYEGVNDSGPFYVTNARYFRDIGQGEEFLRRRSYLLHELAVRSQSQFIKKIAGLSYPQVLPHTSFDYHEKNYRDIVYLARGYGVPLIFMTQPIMPQLGGNESINRSTQKLGGELNVRVFDLAAIMPLDEKYFLPDAVHYTERGNHWIADHLASWIIRQRIL